MIRARILSYLIGASEGRRRGRYSLAVDAGRYSGKRRKPPASRLPFADVFGERMAGVVFA